MPVTINAQAGPHRAQADLMQPPALGPGPSPQSGLTRL